MIRFSMLLALQGRLQELRFKNEAAMHSDLIVGIQAFENGCASSGRFTDAHWPDGKPVRCCFDEHDVLPVHLLDRIGRDRDTLLRCCDWNPGISEHFRAEAVMR